MSITTPPNHHTSNPTNNPKPTTTTATHHSDSQNLLPKPQDKTYAPTTLITPHRLRSQILVSNLKASGILPYHQADSDTATGRPPPLKHSARGLEAIGFDENASMYSSYKGEDERAWKDGRAGKGDGGKKSKRSFLKKLVGRAEEKGEKL
ncbi:MAG: hypothetical protein ALECFALPRED_006910 [Alectoria fallacina]|uniref:Uncharacterized protein n=1 Tax=Alectoria fallacina TaxID=1903189 RepID=A0A8H3GBF5_9LECA|nr:MAG: hypothetical protein ALECFALPRED_006910 [Alectoria fallacina]